MNAGATKPSRKTGFEGPEFSVFFSSKAAHGKRVWRPFKKKIICQNLYRLLLLTLHLYLILGNEVRMKIPWWRCWRWMAGNGSLRFPVRVLIFHVQEESNDEGPGKDGKVEPESREWRFSSKCESAKYERLRLKLWWNQMYVYLLSKLVKTDQYCPRKAEKSRLSTAYIYLVCEPFVVCRLFWRPDLLLKIYIQTTPNLVQNHQWLSENFCRQSFVAFLWFWNRQRRISLPSQSVS